MDTLRFRASRNPASSTTYSQASSSVEAAAPITLDCISTVGTGLSRNANGRGVTLPSLDMHCKQAAHVEVATHTSSCGYKDLCSTTLQESSLHLEQISHQSASIAASLVGGYEAGLHKAENFPPPAGR